MSKAEHKRMCESRAEDDHRTLTRAAEVEDDPERMKFVARHHAKQTRALMRVGRSLGGRIPSRGGARG